MHTSLSLCHLTNLWIKIFLGYTVWHTNDLQAPLLTLSTSAFVNRFMPRHKLAYVNPIMHYAKRENVLDTTIHSAKHKWEHFLGGLNKWIMVNNVSVEQRSRNNFVYILHVYKLCGFLHPLNFCYYFDIFYSFYCFQTLSMLSVLLITTHII